MIAIYFKRKSLINCDNNNNLMDFIKLETKENKLNGNVRVMPTSYLREQQTNNAKSQSSSAENLNNKLLRAYNEPIFEKKTQEEGQGDFKKAKKALAKEKLLETLQKHSELKSKYEELIQSNTSNKLKRSNSHQIQLQNKISILSYNQINESEYAHVPLKQGSQSMVKAEDRRSKKVQDFTYVTIFNGYCLEKFQVIKFFNQGISGKVYLAQNTKTLNLFSIKMIKKQSLTAANFDQLIREIKIQSFLNHPNIVKLYHTFVDKQYIYLFLEPCLDGDLCQKSKKFTEKQTREIIKQVCNAVEYMHKNDIIHRDLKPQNLLMHEGAVKICDFGWAVYSPLLRDSRCSSQLYTSPESTNRQLYDSKIDIWNIGILTYELLFGSVPFEIKNIDEINKMGDQQIYFSEEISVSDSAKEFILGCLDKNKYKRYSIRQAIEHDFLKGSSDKYRMSMM